MKKVATICVMAVVWFGLTGTVQAVRPVMPPMVIPVKPFKPFISISIKPDILDLGIIPHRGSLLTQMEAHIVANCPHQVRASFAPFAQQRQRGRVSIRPEDMSVVINGVDVPIARTAVPIISSVKPTPAGGVDVPVDMKFSLDNAVRYPAGQYEGTLTFTVMAGL